MTGIHSKLAALLLAGSATLLAGCDTSSDGGGTLSAKSLPVPGSYVHVQFRRDFLGLASDKPTTPMGEGMSMALAASGELKGITDEFVVLQVDNEANRELWVPRSAILLLDVRVKPPQE
jgi:hypothetical protein